MPARFFLADTVLKKHLLKVFKSRNYAVTSIWQGVRVALAELCLYYARAFAPKGTMEGKNICETVHNHFEVARWLRQSHSEAEEVKQFYQFDEDVEKGEGTCPENKEN